MKLIATALSLLAASQSLASPTPKSSDVWIGLNLEQCLTNATTIPPPNLVAQKETARKVIAGYNAWDRDSILEYRAPECEQQVLPASMNRAAQSNDEYGAYFDRIKSLYSDFTVTVMEEIHDAEAHSCIIHASSTASTAIGPYANEYALIIEFTKDGKNVTKIYEFVDSDYSKKFVAELAKQEPA
ncbi:hypothetical protein Ptr902_10495 [Pyrenophora tritici-repentis]|nr:hypothetical protein Ptr902_10495 [Pyrenophora tritici-repentis]